MFSIILGTNTTIIGKAFIFDFVTSTEKEVRSYISDFVWLQTMQIIKFQTQKITFEMKGGKFPIFVCETHVYF